MRHEHKPPALDAHGALDGADPAATTAQQFADLRGPDWNFQAHKIYFLVPVLIMDVDKFHKLFGNGILDAKLCGRQRGDQRLGDKIAAPVVII